MTNEQIEQYRAIVEGAPEGATHVDDSLSFWIDYGSNGLCMAVNGKFVKGFIPLNPRRLEDLQTIADQYDELQAKDKRIAELERERDKRDLEQQIKALESLMKNESSVFRLHNGNKRSAVFCQDIQHEIDALKLRKGVGD